MLAGNGSLVTRGLAPMALKVSGCVAGHSRWTGKRGGLAEARVGAGDWLTHGPERRHTSAVPTARATGVKEVLQTPWKGG